MRESEPSSPKTDRTTPDLQISTLPSDYSDSDDCEDIVARRPDEDLAFGNISVVSSNDVHFGNKTIYQGPVTIKQFLYANGDAGAIADKGAEVVLGVDGVANKGFVSDNGKVKDLQKDGFVPEGGTSVDKSFRLLEKLSQRKVLLLGLSFTVAVALMTLLTVLLVKHAAPAEYSKDDQLPVDGKLRMVSKEEWVGQPANGPIDNIQLPVPMAIIHHTATNNCSSESQCKLRVRLIQEFHVGSRGWNDIGYNFLVGGDGQAYEGRGWTKIGAHALGYNQYSMGIALIGTFTKHKAPEIQLTALKKLLELGVQLKYLKEDYKLVAARQLFTTDSPGEPVLEELKKWPHWAEKWMLPNGKS